MIGRGEAVAELERRLGYAFADRELLERGLTHASVGETNPRIGHNERLEFLGDRVLNLLIAEELINRMPQAHEGELSRVFHQLVNAQACADAARAMGLPDALRLGGGASKLGVRKSDRVLGDACEALIAALYLDAGLAETRRVVIAFWGERLAHLQPGAIDPKTRLQQWALGQGLPLPSYRVLDQSGTAHDPVFTVEVFVKGFEPASARAGSKREAERLAAVSMLARQGTA